ncbi:Trypanosomal VSG domain [Trypanosoma brucei equiperdum]|uniref:Trypanosomal VSG domain n=1 Tax=Trypanosoma brucei equiperdum TaxID=630700 RepID=A0A3L6KSK3_9TRYP|nr:Trypanosomal VSG domain [Trypanosoma brucei equiperdum]RHW66866.1 Trypanosomal VSG domain [Trypanosoma brucei equiperdum]RHW66868.1 Trypanosomal VSG domain [Trypanosoma brucei equiperdum]RHW66884.1 Trypanosomal VSG domain [Trypanosoma brucei equiperdum]RHW66921.1 Trypanosomal VSG domain [Trypanosoma brucei equiperdum]
MSKRFTTCATLISLVTAARAAYENAKQYEALCGAYAITKQAISDAEYIGDTTGDPRPKEVEDLYIMTLSDEDYNNKTLTGVTEEGGLEKRKSDILQRRDTYGREIHSIPANSEAREAAHVAIKRLFYKAGNLSANIAAWISSIKADTRSAGEALNRARCGQADCKAPDQKWFETRSKACSGTGEQKQGMTIASDISCLCSATAGDTLCSTAATGSTYRSSASTAADALTGWSTTIADCDKNVIPKGPSPEDIAATIAAFRQVLRNRDFTGGGSKKTFVLGHGGAGDCNGGTSSAACVDYSSKLANGNINDIPWIAHLRTAATKLTEVANKRTSLEGMRREMKIIADQAWQAFALAAIPLTAEKTKPQIVQQTKEEDCNKHETPDKCAEPCKWEANAAEKNKKCSLDHKKGRKQATQTAGTEDKKEEKCKGKGKKECGEATECKWQGETFKDSSFFFNKKFL